MTILVWKLGDAILVQIPKPQENGDTKNGPERMAIGGEGGFNVKFLSCTSFPVKMYEMIPDTTILKWCVIKSCVGQKAVNFDGQWLYSTEDTCWGIKYYKLLLK